MINQKTIFLNFFFVKTILLEDRQQKLHCVGCEDVDSDILKDDPGKTIF